MSFLLADDSLEATLALLDGYDGSDIADELGSDLDATLASVEASPCLVPRSRSPPSSASTTPRLSDDVNGSDCECAGRRRTNVAAEAKAKRSNAPASMRLRRKRKAERLHLREQVAELEALRRRLRRTHGANGTQSSASAPQQSDLPLPPTVGQTGLVLWAEVAAQIQREREMAEVENVQLRDILAKQLKFARNLEGLLQKRGVFQGIDLVFRPPQPTRSPSTLVNFNSTTMLGDIEQRIQEMYSDIGSVLSSAGVDAMTSHLTMKQCPGSAEPFMEVKSTTPLTCSFEDALGIVATASKLKESLTNKRLIHRRDDDSFSEKIFMVMLQDERHDVSLRGVYLMRKFAGEGHVAYVCSSIVRPALEDGLQFRECGWSMLSRSPTDPQRASTFQTCYHVYPESQGFRRGDSQTFQRLESLERFVLNSYARSTRTLMQRVQDTLLDELERQERVVALTC